MKSRSELTSVCLLDVYLWMYPWMWEHIWGIGSGTEEYRGINLMKTYEIAAQLDRIKRGVSDLQI